MDVLSFSQSKEWDVHGVEVDSHPPPLRAAKPAKPVENCYSFNPDEFAASILADRRVAAGIVHSTALSPPEASWSGRENLLACASSSGNVNVHEFKARDGSFSEKCALTISAHEGPAFRVQSRRIGNEDMLFSCGKDGTVLMWQWETIRSQMDGASYTSDHLILPAASTYKNLPVKHGDGLTYMPETFDFAVNEQAHQLYTATGHVDAGMWDLQTEQHIGSLKGHTANIQCIKSCPQANVVATGSHDGTCRLWDTRSLTCTATIDPWAARQVAGAPPSTNPRQPRVTCLETDASDLWLACGTAGGTVTLFNRCFLSAAALRIDLPVPVHALHMGTDQEILVGGATDTLTRWSFKGQLISRQTTGCPSVFSILKSETGQFTVVSGRGSAALIYSQFGTCVSAITTI